MRLKWGPHAGQAAEQVLLRDPLYVAAILADLPDAVLSAIFRDLMIRFDARPLAIGCARCGAAAQGVCAYPGSTALIGFCQRCVLISGSAPPMLACRVTTYEDALRHVANSFQHSHRVQMRRIIGSLVLAKGGRGCLTETAARRFLGPQPRSPDGVDPAGSG